jgi:hypothetical protein
MHDESRRRLGGRKSVATSCRVTGPLRGLDPTPSVLSRPCTLRSVCAADGHGVASYAGLEPRHRIRAPRSLSHCAVPLARTSSLVASPVGPQARPGAAARVQRTLSRRVPLTLTYPSPARFARPQRFGSRSADRCHAPLRHHVVDREHHRRVISQYVCVAGS